MGPYNMTDARPLPVGTKLKNFSFDMCDSRFKRILRKYVFYRGTMQLKK